jgi:beta-glucosidase
MEAFGVSFWLAPGMNIHRNPLCGRNFEYFSEDPVLAGFTAASLTQGVQSHAGCYVTIKHFAANNQEDNRNHSNSIVGQRALREIYLKGFRLAVREGKAKGVMTSYNLLNGTYTANSRDLCTQLLRDEWGFTGVVMSDWFSTSAGMADPGLALAAGNDLIMPGGPSAIKALKRGLQQGRFNAEDLARSCRRVLEAIAASQIQQEFDKLL